MSPKRLNKSLYFIYENMFNTCKLSAFLKLFCYRQEK